MPPLNASDALMITSESVRSKASAAATEPPPVTQYPTYEHAIARVGAGVAAVALLHPLDTIRTHMQSSQTVAARIKTSRPQSVLRLIKYVVLNQGVSALYRGLAPASLGSILSRAFYFHVVQRTRNLLSPYLHNNASLNFVSSTFAGVVTSVTTNPIWVVKVRAKITTVENYVILAA